MNSGFDSFPVQFVYRHMGKSEALEALTIKKLRHSLGHLPKVPISCKVTFSLNGDSHHTQVSVVTGVGFDIHCHAESESMYEAVDHLNAKLLHQIEKHRSSHDKSKTIEGDNLTST